MAAQRNCVFVKFVPKIELWFYLIYFEEREPKASCHGEWKKRELSRVPDFPMILLWAWDSKPHPAKFKASVLSNLPCPSLTILLRLGPRSGIQEIDSDQGRAEHGNQWTTSGNETGTQGSAWTPGSSHPWSLSFSLRVDFGESFLSLYL